MPKSMRIKSEPAPLHTTVRDPPSSLPHLKEIYLKRFFKMKFTAQLLYYYYWDQIVQQISLAFLPCTLCPVRQNSIPEPAGLGV